MTDNSKTGTQYDRPSTPEIIDMFLSGQIPEDFCPDEYGEWTQFFGDLHLVLKSKGVADVRAMILEEADNNENLMTLLSGGNSHALSTDAVAPESSTRL